VDRKKELLRNLLLAKQMKGSRTSRICTKKALSFRPAAWRTVARFLITKGGRECVYNFISRTEATELGVARVVGVEKTRGKSSRDSHDRREKRE